MDREMIDSVIINIMFMMQRFWFEIRATKYENITSIPPIQIRKIRNATHDDIEQENVIARTRDIIKIIIPIDIGFRARNIENAIEDIVIINNVKIIYNYKNCTCSIDFKGLCALYTNL